MKLQPASTKNLEKFTCQFLLRNPLTGIPNTTHGYITQQKEGRINLDQSRDSICKTFKTQYSLRFYLLYSFFYVSL